MYSLKKERNPVIKQVKLVTQSTMQRDLDFGEKVDKMNKMVFLTVGIAIAVVTTVRQEIQACRDSIRNCNGIYGDGNDDNNRNYGDGGNDSN